MDIAPLEAIVNRARNSATGDPFGLVGAWVAVAETAKGRGKSGRSRSIASCNLVAAAISLALSPRAFAAPPAAPCIPPICGAGAVSATSRPIGGQIVSGSARITQSGNTTYIRQSSPDISIDWLSFNIGAQATVDFIQPSASAIAVNRIAGTNGSEILGHLDANGQVYLINPNGIIFGQGAQINVGGLVASTLDEGDSNLSGDVRSFAGNGTGSIINQDGEFRPLTRIPVLRARIRLMVSGRADRSSDPSNRVHPDRPS